MNTKRYAVNMTEGPLVRSILQFALPVMLSGLLQLTFNAADVIVVGRCAGDTALAAVTSSSPLINMLLNAFVGLSMGTNVVVARALGRGDEEYVERAVHSSVTLGILCGLVLGTFGFFAAPVILTYMGTPESVIGEAALYLRIYFMGVPFSMTYNLSSAVLRGSGDTRRPMKFLMVSGAVNLALNLVFVLGFGLGVAGVAIATALANGLSCFLVLRCLVGETGPQHLDFGRLGIRGEVLWHVIGIGLPASFQAVLVALSNVVVQSSINSFGDVVMAGSGASANIEGFVWTAMNAFYQACLTFTSRNLGNGRLDRVDKTLGHSLWLVVSVGFAAGGTACLLGPQLLGFYTNSAQAVEYGMTRMFIVCLPYFLLGMSDVLMGSMRGMGHSLPPMIASMLCMCGFRVVWVSTVFRWNPTLTMLCICYPLSWSMLLMIQFLNWLLVRRKVRRQYLKKEGDVL